MNIRNFSQLKFHPIPSWWPDHTPVPDHFFEKPSCRCCPCRERDRYDAIRVTILENPEPLTPLPEDFEKEFGPIEIDLKKILAPKAPEADPREPESSPSSSAAGYNQLP